MQSSLLTGLNTLMLHHECIPQEACTQRELVALPHRALLRLESSPRPRGVVCSMGMVWVTLEGSRADVILGSGESIELSANGLVVVEALVDSVVEI